MCQCVSLLRLTSYVWNILMLSPALIYFLPIATFLPMDMLCTGLLFAHGFDRGLSCHLCGFAH